MCGEKLGISVCATHAGGITPACAGKRRSCSQTLRRSWDHPRVCGEKKESLGHEPSEKGSPPRVRGKAKEAGTTIQGSGITPACAGKSAVPRKISAPSEDHPRVCGEKTLPALFPFIASGSPPRVRGKVDKRLENCIQIGITPACAGKRLKKALKNKDF